ncbi:EMP/nonaspanin domain family protein [Ectocarpus siliculosus]|uniref:Transmembrane 9 superfamily member n=1 Tax=Ectocarpus siliculosus TaxID=2880 RepID=D7G7H8_ECTSI|nr:EMP/nonaspanin domain family protein [Ectocarpus siliculosus]|eukprot:CBJ27720.1 EMP/nonaspanin domain family protein [Ectocarpus siliculosus]
MAWTSLALLAVAGGGGSGVEASWLPSIGPKVFDKGSKLPLFVNELTSVRTQAPLDHYHVAYCRPEHLHENAENIGAYLEGDREENSLYDLEVGVLQACRVLCSKTLKPQERYMFASVIRDGYQSHMSITHLPAAYDPKPDGKAGKLTETPVTTSMTDDQEHVYQRGFPVGFRAADGKAFLNNHLRFTVAINARDIEETQFHIVGFLVEPMSVVHEFQTPYHEGAFIETCSEQGYTTNDPSRYLNAEYEGEILFTYDVTWDYTTMPWTQRWDIYTSGAVDNQIHWFSITNSSVIVMFLTVLVAMIMVRALRKDIQRYNAEDMEEANEETGWKLVHGDVLRPPTTAPMLFAVCVGTGVQLWSVSFLVLFFSVMRLVSPLKRGDMLTVCLLIYVLTGGIAGYNSAKIHRRFRGTEWMKMTLLTAFSFPALAGSVFVLEGIQQWFIGSTGAVPVRILVLLVAMLLFVQTPLVFLGSFYGFKKEQPPQVVRTNQIPRMIPQTPWYVDPKVAVPFAGVLPFGAVLVELVFVMTAMWEQQLYYIFGFLMSVMLILTVTCAEISIVMCYFQLCSEDYRWWWRSLLWSGSCAGWMFIYSVGYYFTVLNMSGWMAASLFFGYTFVMTSCFFLLTGTVGYFSCQWFINVIYSSIKVD